MTVLNPRDASGRPTNLDSVERVPPAIVQFEPTWIAGGYGYAIMGLVVLAAWSSTFAAARSGRWIDKAEE